MPVLLQLTDLHLFAEKGTLLKGVDPWQSLASVVDTILRWQIDFGPLVLTGDLAHDGRGETYVQLKEALGGWSACNFVPGNHDDRSRIGLVYLFSGVLTTIEKQSNPPPRDRITFSFAAENWRVLGLDTLVPDELRGELGAEQLAWLKAELAAHANSPTLIFMHHPPVDVHSAWLDRIGLTDRDPFCRLIESSPQVKLICCGHIHQEFEARIGGATVLAAPSTSVQFKPGTETLEVDDLPPGMRVIRLQGDTFETQVIRAAR